MMEFIDTLLNKIDQFFSLSPQEIERESNSYQQDDIERDLDFNSIVSDSEKNMTIIKPSSFEDTQQIADELKNKQSVLLNLSDVEHQLATRIIDFISGVIYALDGNVEKVSEGIFLFAPETVEINYQADNNGLSKEEKESLYAK